MLISPATPVVFIANNFQLICVSVGHKLLCWPTQCTYELFIEHGRDHGHTHSQLISEFHKGNDIFLRHFSQTTFLPIDIYHLQCRISGSTLNVPHFRFWFFPLTASRMTQRRRRGPLFLACGISRLYAEMKTHKTPFLR